MIAEALGVPLAMPMGVTHSHPVPKIRNTLARAWRFTNIEDGTVFCEVSE